MKEQLVAILPSSLRWPEAVWKTMKKEQLWSAVSDGVGGTECSGLSRGFVGCGKVNTGCRIRTPGFKLDTAAG